MRLKRLALTLLLIALMTGSCCTGCWNRREPELLGIVLAVGFDYDQERGLYQVFAQLANPIALGGAGGDGGGGGGAGGKKPFWTVDAKGRTPFEAIRNLIEVSSRELFWAHCRVVLFSENLARRGLKDIFDLFERERQFRLIVKPVVIDGDLRQIMEADFPLEETGGRGMDRFIVTTRFERGIFPERNLNELLVVLSQPGQEMLAGRLEVLESEKKSGEKGGEAGIAPPARIGGSALFRGDRMVGWANARQTQGWAFATGRAFRSNFVIESPATGSNVNIEVHRHKAKMSLSGDDKNWKIKMEVKLYGRVTEFDGHEILSDESELTRSLERRAATTARNRIEDILSRAQELKSDIFGFGNLIYRKNPRLWEKIGPRWDEEIFPRLKIDLKVNFVILRAGLIKDPL